MREKHRQLHGIIKPIDDVFWKQYYPPLDWRCRCDVVATAADPKGEVPKDMPTPNFVGNVALDQEIFTQKGNFFKLLNSDENAKRNMELMKLNAPYELAYKAKNGNKVMVNIFKDPVDYDKNLDVAIILTEEVKINVFIRPHIDVIRPKGSNIPSNAEYLINGKLSDLKWNFKENNYNGIKSAIDSAKNQGCKSIVFDFTHSFKNLDITKVNQALRGKITETRGKWVEDVYLIYETKAIKVTREEILQDKLLEKLENLKADSK